MKNSFINWIPVEICLSDVKKIDESSIALINISKVMIISDIKDDGRVLPIGCFLYKNRVKYQRRRGITVCKSTFRKNRVAILKAFLLSLDGYGFNRSETAYKYLDAFIAYLDKNDSLLHSLSFSECFESYCEYLRMQISIYDKIVNIGISLQRASELSSTIRGLVEIAEGSNACDHIAAINTKGYVREPTIAANDDDLSYTLNFWTSLYRQLYDFSIEEKEYPFYLNLPGEKFLVLPKAQWAVTKENSKESCEKAIKNGGWGINSAWDVTSGRIRTPEESRDYVNSMRGNEAAYISAQRRIVNDAAQGVRDANSNPLNRHRTVLYNWAIKAYFMHFLIITGMNDSTAATLDIEDIEDAKSKVKFRGFKARAGGKDVVFEIQKIFYSYFKDYLSLRMYFLRILGVETKRLFFTVKINPNYASDFKSDGSCYSGIKVKATKTIDRNLPKVKSREARKSKGDWVTKQYGIEAAAFTLQHSLDTNVQTYQEVSEEVSESELTEFYKEFNSKINAGKGFEKIASGKCESPGVPFPEDEYIDSKKIDCNSPEGCLFCKKYRVHSDEEDIRKLLSMRFVMVYIENKSDSLELYRSLIEPVISRIDLIIDAIGSKSDAINSFIREIEEDVNVRENLDEYWNLKYEILDDIGVV